MYLIKFCVLSVFVFGTCFCAWPPTCDDNIYCYGDLLHTVQMSRIFEDSKTFVDMKMKFDRIRTLHKFDELMSESFGQPNRTQVQRFVEKHFDKPGSEFEEWNPDDWKENPKILRKIVDEEARQWVKDLNGLWKELGRKMKNDVKLNEDRYSIIYVQNPVIIPGGRFREFYYWDSYWIVLGLIHSEMFTTVKGMLLNFISIIDRIGFVPNGGRKYYKMRSQPPLLIPMVKLYIQATGDYQFLNQNIDKLEKELQFWLNNRTVTIERGSKKYTLARYADSSAGPRPESYYEDVMVAQAYPNEHSKMKLYSQIKSVAESGWDFSSRWFVTEDGSTGGLKDIKAKSIIPVDLNSIICSNMDTLSEFYETLNDYKKALIYARLAQQWKKAINKILWHDDVGIWLDYNIDEGVRRNNYFVSNLFPLWTRSYDDSRDDVVDKVLHYLTTNNIVDYVGGVPSSLVNTGQQWDFPNAWPPAQYAVIKGLDSTDNECARNLAKSLASKWVRSNFKAYKLTKSMFEKYDARISGGRGGGGEYENQIGFGWTNGVIMDLLDYYPDALAEPSSYDYECSEVAVSSASYTLSKHYLLIMLLITTIVQKSTK